MDKWKHSLSLWIPRWFIIFGSLSLLQDGLVFRLTLTPKWNGLTESVGIDPMIFLINYALIIIHFMFLLMGVILLMNRDPKL